MFNRSSSGQSDSEPARYWGVEFPSYELPVAGSREVVSPGFAHDLNNKSLSATMVTHGRPIVGQTDSQIEGLLAGMARVHDVMGANRQIKRYTLSIGTRGGSTRKLYEMMERLRRHGTSTAAGETDDIQRMMDDMEAGATDFEVRHSFTMHCRSRKRFDETAGRFIDALVPLQAVILGARDRPSPLGFQGGWTMTRDELILATRQTLDPVWFERWGARLRAKDNFGSGVIDPSTAWPVYRDWQSNWCQLGESPHICLAVAEIPKDELDAKLIHPLIILPVPKWVSIITEILPYRKARRWAKINARSLESVILEQEKKRIRPDEELIRDFHNAQADLEEVVNSGHHVGRTWIVVAVSGNTHEEAIRHAGMAQNAATLSNVELTPLTNEQKTGIDAVLPFARGV